MSQDILLTDTLDVSRDGTGDIQLTGDEGVQLRQQATIGVAEALREIGEVPLTPTAVATVEGGVRDRLRARVDGPVSVSVDRVSPSREQVTITATVGTQSLTVTNGL